jgi:hypothetical protein
MRRNIMLVSIKRELFEGKIVVDVEINDLYHKLFKNGNKNKKILFNDMFGDLIKENIEIILENLDGKYLGENIPYSATLKNIFESYYIIKDTYNFFVDFGIDGCETLFISEKDAKEKFLEKELNLTELKDFLTDEEFENVLTEELKNNFHYFETLKRRLC